MKLLFVCLQQNIPYFLILQSLCELPQLHLLSVHMSKELHLGCPTNCEDILTWLPTDMAIKLMSYLDPGMTLQSPSYLSIFIVQYSLCLFIFCAKCLGLYFMEILILELVRNFC